MPLPEKKIIERIRRAAAKQSTTLVEGIGDDCAILRPPAGQELLVTTDFSLEGTHFRREWHPAESVGHRCLARGLSDIAAMGGRPVAAFLSLALPTDLPQSWVDGFMRGFLRLADRHKTVLAGGDTSESRSGVLADIMVLGYAPRGRAIRRAGARPGDILYVTGALGGSAAVLERLFQPQINADARRMRPDSKRHFFPEPRVAVAQYLLKRRLATAMIDLSDGLSTDLAHICEESGVGATLVEPLIPVAQGATLAQALHGGEDYELLFTARPKAKIPLEIAGGSVAEIGWVDAQRGMRITGRTSKAQSLKVKGWEYFQSR
ncbi:MAG: thiamine-phosphate kinase [Acidobacteriales bacterium]|nr:thiamine-phosphate kinase [Terriglobales bacterium]